MPRIRTGTVFDSIPGGRHAPKKELSWLSVLSCRKETCGLWLALLRKDPVYC